MAREYVPVPIEYLSEMEPLSDENFGRLIRALLRYGQDGTPIDLTGDCRFYAVRVMNKDDHYAARAEEEEEKRRRASRRNSRNALARYAAKDRQEEVAGDCMQSAAMAGNTKPDQTNPDQTIPFQTNTISAESEVPSAAAPAIPLNDGSEFFAEEKDLMEWKLAYPAVDAERDAFLVPGKPQAAQNQKRRAEVYRFLAFPPAGQGPPGHGRETEKRARLRAHRVLRREEHAAEGL